MKFKANSPVVDSNVEPSNEFVEILLPLIPLAVILVKMGVDKFEQWKNAKEYDKYKDKIRPIRNIDNNVGHIAWIVGNPLNSNINIPNSNTKGITAPGASHAVKYDLFKTAILACKKANDDLLKLYVGGNTSEGLQTLITDLQNKVPVRRDNNGKIEVEFKKDGISWPSDPYYKSLDKVCKEFLTLCQNVYHQLNKLRENAFKSYDKAEKTTSEDTIKECATFINCVDVLVFMSLGVINEFIENLKVIETESSVEDDSNPNTYWKTLDK